MKAQHLGAWLKKLGSSKIGDQALESSALLAIISAHSPRAKTATDDRLAQRKGPDRVKLQGLLFTTLDSQTLYFNYKLI